MALFISPNNIPLPLADRPRERLQNNGPEALSVAELLCVVLGRGITGLPIQTMAQNIISQFGSLSDVADASLQDLTRIRGLGTAKACQLIACFELARRLSAEQMPHVGSLGSSKALISPQLAAHSARMKIQDFNKEYCFVLSFDIRNKLIAVDELSVGILNANLVHPRETFSLAIKRHAAGLVLVHNHPSGDLEPSTDDLDVTTRLGTAGKIMGIEFLDHIIISRAEFSSLKEKGLL